MIRYALAALFAALFLVPAMAAYCDATYRAEADEWDDE